MKNKLKVSFYSEPKSSAVSLNPRSSCCRKLLSLTPRPCRWRNLLSLTPRFSGVGSRPKIPPTVSTVCHQPRPCRITRIRVHPWLNLLCFLRSLRLLAVVRVSSFIFLPSIFLAYSCQFVEFVSYPALSERILWFHFPFAFSAPLCVSAVFSSVAISVFIRVHLWFHFPSASLRVRRFHQLQFPPEKPLKFNFI
jgi:hypothetical protein